MEIWVILRGGTSLSLWERLVCNLGLLNGAVPHQANRSVIAERNDSQNWNGTFHMLLFWCRDHLRSHTLYRCQIKEGFSRNYFFRMRSRATKCRLEESEKCRKFGEFTFGSTNRGLK